MKRKLLRVICKARTLLLAIFFCLLFSLFYSPSESDYFRSIFVNEKSNRFLPIAQERYNERSISLENIRPLPNIYLQLDNASFCEAKFLGCFAPSKVKKNEVSFPSMTRTWCFKTCSSRNAKYAGLTNGVTCICAHYTVDMVVDILNSQSQCNISCFGDAQESCGGRDQIEAFNIIKPCFNGQSLSSSTAESRFLGCYNLTETKNFFVLKSFSKCVLLCSTLKKHHALWNPKRATCSCQEFVENIDWRNHPSECTHPLLQVYLTFAESNRCKPATFLPPDNKVKLFALASHPGSGNSWVRHLIDQASGIYTGCLYHDRTLFYGGLLGEMLNPNGKRIFLVKDHVDKVIKYSQVAGAVVLLRNPFKTHIADFHRQKTSNDHVGHVKNERFYTQEFVDFLKSQRPWHKIIELILESKKPFHILVYEKLLQDPVGEVRKVMKFLSKEAGFKQNDLEERLLCMKENLKGSFKRKSQPLERDPFPPEIKKQIFEEIQLGKKLLWEANIHVDFPNYNVSLS